MIDVAAFVAHLRMKESPARTVDTYRSSLRMYSGVYTEITVPYVQSWVSRYSTPASKRTVVAALRAYCRWADIEMNWSKLVLPRKTRKMPRALGEDEYDRVLRFIRARDEHYSRVFVLAAHTALRSSEIRSLTASDLIERNGSKHLVIRSPKNHQDRAVPLDAVASRVIGELGLPIKFRRQRLNELIIEARETLGIERFVPHTLRKTCLTRLYKSGADVVSLARFAGHRDVNSLMDYLSTDADSIRKGVFGRAS